MTNTMLVWRRKAELVSTNVSRIEKGRALAAVFSGFSRSRLKSFALLFRLVPL
jgi:hypothetical protein